MQKFLLTVSLLTFNFLSVFSQPFKPEPKNIVVGLSLQSPFASGSPFSLINGGLNGRYFIKSNSAIRTNINFTRNADRQNHRDSVPFFIYKPTESKFLQEGYSKTSNTMFELRIGKEKHFTGTDRLDPYIGGDIILGFGANKSKDENYNAKQGKTETNYLKESKQRIFSFGMALVLGADYYIFPKLYLGTEFGWNFIYKKIGDKTTQISYDKVNNVGNGVVRFTEPDSVSAGSSNFTSGSGMTTASFRIGFRF